jgi:L-cysteate sulfo-lyase
MRKGESIPTIFETLKSQGKKPYVVPYGGSNEVGAIGFDAALIELQQQLENMEENISHIVFASSSGGTHSGMILGKELTNQSYSLIGINIDKDKICGMTLYDYILTLANKTAHHLGRQCTFNKADVELNSDYIGEGYAVIGELEREAISLIAKHEGILLDPVYTGRAMGGMVDMIRKGRFSPEDTVLFWHTGGSPALFAYAANLVYPAFLMNIVSIWLWLLHCCTFSKLAELYKFTQAQKVRPGNAIFYSVLAANIVYYEVCAYLFTAKNFEPGAA